MQLIWIMRLILGLILGIVLILQKQLNKILLDDHTYLKFLKENQPEQSGRKRWLKQFYKGQGDVLFFSNILSIVVTAALIYTWFLK